ncbi:MAG: 50S ribosome-binding GTPase [Candidatus Kerfeldbacteria bacterium]|nr:50S ribosome-binding GTPase [Candidatus Kerfeldbacteria bacterium]
MKQLLVFMGKPGVGKTTLINELFPGHTIIDARPFVLKYMVDGEIPEDKTILGYRDMYAALGKLTDPIIILELGTNHEQLNVKQLAAFAQQADVRVFICTASVETLRKRVIERSIHDDMEAMERRFARDFPNSHLALFEQVGIEPYFLDMEQPMTDNVILVRQALR